MFRLLKAFIHDTLAWGLLLLLCLTAVVAMASLFKRYERVDSYKVKLAYMEYDIAVLENDLVRQRKWAERLQGDLIALEQVAREKMNYLGPDEVLLSFYPAQSGKP